VDSRPVPTLRAALDLYFEDAGDRRLKESTLSSYRDSLEPFANAPPKDLINAIDLSALDRWRHERQVAPRTARKEIEHLRTFFEFCYDRQWIERNPARRLRMPKVDDIATLPFTEEEVAALLQASDRIASTNPRMTPYIRHRARAILYVML
jgi:site-specific recombinase XerD